MNNGAAVWKTFISRREEYDLKELKCSLYIYIKGVQLVSTENRRVYSQEMFKKVRNSLR